MAEPDLFVVCSNCGNEVSPYVTECPYCGQRLRKRAPDIKSIKKREQKAQAREEKVRRRSARTPRFGRRRGDREVPAYLRTRSLPVATTVLILLSVGLSLAARVDGFPLYRFVVFGGLDGDPWKLVTAPLIHVGFGFGFVALVGCAIFGTGLERRFGPWITAAVWLVSGAAGMGLELLIAPTPQAHGASGVALGLLAAWLVVVVENEDIRDVDTYGLLAVSTVLLALPIATAEASIWAAIGGLVAGALCGLALARRQR